MSGGCDLWQTETRFNILNSFEPSGIDSNCLINTGLASLLQHHKRVRSLFSPAPWWQTPNMTLEPNELKDRYALPANCLCPLSLAALLFCQATNTEASVCTPATYIYKCARHIINRLAFVRQIVRHRRRVADLRCIEST